MFCIPKKVNTVALRHWQKYYAYKPALIRLLNVYKKIFKRLGFRNTVKWETKRLGNREGISVELFWAIEPNTTIPTFIFLLLKLAIQFAFECVPRYCYEINGQNIPFGCHAWNDTILNSGRHIF